MNDKTPLNITNIRLKTSDHHSSNHNDCSHSIGSKASIGENALVVAIVVTLTFMVVELVGGWYSNSLALMSDAAHMLTDAGGLILSWLALWIAKQPRTKQNTYGYHRAEVLGALASGLTIWIIAGFLIYEALARLSSPPEVKGPLVIVVAVIGLVANLFSMKMLHHAKDHSLNLKGAYLHLFADLLGSVGALVSGLIIWQTGWVLIDPILSILFAGLMLLSSWELVRESVEILMEFAPPHIDSKEIQSALQLIPTVTEVHDLHVWTVGNQKASLSVHLISPESTEVLAQAKELLRDRFDIRHSTIQIEHPEKFRREDCYDCES